MTNKTKPTAVEWLHQEMLKGILSMKEILEKAKEMEKKQIIDAHGDDRSYLQDDGSWKRINGEQYYNETYGGNK